jgi:GxxExxY protein
MNNTFNEPTTPRFGGQNISWEFPHRDLTDRVIGAAIFVHRQLGPGFLEKLYENALNIEFSKRGILFNRQVSVQVLYDGKVIGMHRLDMIIEQKVVLELKAVKEIEDIHLATTLSYLKATQLEVGLILNFAAARLLIRRVVRTEKLTAEAQKGGSAEG